MLWMNWLHKKFCAESGGTAVFGELLHLSNIVCSLRHQPSGLHWGSVFGQECWCNLSESEIYGCASLVWSIKDKEQRMCEIPLYVWDMFECMYTKLGEMNIFDNWKWKINDVPSHENYLSSFRKWHTTQNVQSQHWPFCMIFKVVHYWWGAENLGCCGWMFA